MNGNHRLGSTFHTLVGLALLSISSIAWPAAAAIDVRITAGGGAGGEERREVEIVHTVGKRGFLGVELVELSPELRIHYGADEERGVLVSRVVPESPAEVAGLQVGDVILAVDGVAIRSRREVRRLIARHGEGDAVEIDLIRDGQRRTVAATLEERPGLVVDLAPMVDVGEDGTYHFRFDPERWERFGERMERWGETFGHEVAAATERAVAEAMRGLEDEKVEVEIERQLVERKRLEAQLRVLERQLESMQRQLERMERQLEDER